MARTPRTRGGTPKAEPEGAAQAAVPADGTASADAPAEFAASESLTPDTSGEAPVSTGESVPAGGVETEALAEPPASPDETEPQPADGPAEFSAPESLTPGENAALAEPPGGDYQAEVPSDVEATAEAPPEATETSDALRSDEAAAISPPGDERRSDETASTPETPEAVPMAELEGPGIAAAPVTLDPADAAPAWQETPPAASEGAPTAEEEHGPVADPLQDVPMAELEGPGIAASPVESEEDGAFRSAEEAAQAEAGDERSGGFRGDPVADPVNEVPADDAERLGFGAATEPSRPFETSSGETASAYGGSEGARAGSAVAASALAASPAGGTSGSDGDTRSSTASTPAKGRGGGSLFAAGLLGGLAALLLAGLLQFAGFLPSVGATGSGGGTQAFQSEIDGLKAEVAQLREAGAGGAAGADPALGSRIDTLQADVAQLKSAGPATAAGVPPELETRLSAAEEKLAGLSSGVSAEQLAAVSGEAAAARTAAQNNDGAIQDAAARVATLEQNFSGVQSGVSALQSDVASLRKGMETLQAQPRVALALAASALKEAADRGAPFTAELATLGTLAPDAPEIAQLQPYAESGVPTRDALLADWNASVDAVLATENPVDESAGIMSKLLSGAGSLVSVRPIGAVDGPGTSATVGRIQAAMEGGDLSKAMAEFDTLPDAAKQAASGFAEKARARLAVEGLVNGAIANAAKAA